MANSDIKPTPQAEQVTSLRGERIVNLPHLNALNLAEIRERRTFAMDHIGMGAERMDRLVGRKRE